MGHDWAARIGRDETGQAGWDGGGLRRGIGRDGVWWVAAGRDGIEKNRIMNGTGWVRTQQDETHRDGQDGTQGIRWVHHGLDHGVAVMA